jgi:hypothetical protein
MKNEEPPKDLGNIIEGNVSIGNPPSNYTMGGARLWFNRKLKWYERVWRFFFRRIGEGEEYAWYLGFVTTRFADDAKIVTFLGFNWICQIALRVWLRVRQDVPLWDRRILRRLNRQQRQWDQLCMGDPDVGQRFAAFKHRNDKTPVDLWAWLSIIVLQLAGVYALSFYISAPVNALFAVVWWDLLSKFNHEKYWRKGKK